jgi:hypothetical protein
MNNYGCSHEDKIAWMMDVRTLHGTAGFGSSDQYIYETNGKA